MTEQTRKTMTGEEYVRAAGTRAAAIVTEEEARRQIMAGRPVPVSRDEQAQCGLCG